jgi:hypothetical protein
LALLQSNLVSALVFYLGVLVPTVVAVYYIAFPTGVKLILGVIWLRLPLNQVCLGLTIPANGVFPVFAGS